MRDFQLPGRSPAFAEHGMAATSHPAATLTALDVLRDGGNALDAAVAAAAVQAVVDPGMTGIGGDVFALIGKADGRLLAFNGSGRAPAAVTLDRLEALGVTGLAGTPYAITIPGAVDAWGQLLEAAGTRGLDALLQPAIRFAEDGFVVTPRVAYDWAREGQALQVSDAARTFYLKDGRPPVAGQRMALPVLAGTLRRLAREGARAFYEGEMAETMAAYLGTVGGLHADQDFARAKGEFVPPIRSDYRGIEVVECPPNGQGVITLLLLNILEGFDFGGLDPAGAERLHLEAEAGRLAFNDRDACLADPAQSDVPLARLLSKRYAGHLRDRIDPARAADELPPALLPEHPDTVYITVVDRDRTVVSFINSIFDTFGSGYVCPSTGVLFHCRGKSFSLARGHPNAIAPGKRPLHTIIPALGLQGGRPTIGFGVMGGHYQPVGQAHVLSNLVDFGMDPQEALDAPRAFAYDGVLQLERGIGEAAGRALADRGHTIVRPEKPLGCGQMIMIDHARGVLIGGSDPRKDGVALGY